MNDTQKIISINIENEMHTSYIDYSMSVIVARALPDLRDGLKPVHRRVLYGMYQLGMFYNRSFKKSARVVGEVLGKFHPHSDTAIYDTVVRMAQDFSLRYPLIDGQGNFGSIDGDNAAAMRYTEVRLKKITDEILHDIDKNTVDFQPNFDASLKEPSVLPAMLPNLLINGSSGIAVGMATNMPPHNLGEVIDGIIAYLDNSDISIDELMNHIQAPDFPTGGIICGINAVKDAYITGRGKITLRGRINIEEIRNGREQIIISEIPYMVNKSLLVERIAGLVHNEKLVDINEIRDESNREGIRIVIALKKHSESRAVIHQLYKYTQMQTTVSIINLALYKGRPQVLTLKELIVYFVDHRLEIIIRRTLNDITLAEKRAHILEGLRIALNNLDKIIVTIRQSKTPPEAAVKLQQNFMLTNIQAHAILDMRLQKLTGLEREKIDIEYHEIAQKIIQYRKVLSHKKQQYAIIRKELLNIKKQYADERRTDINTSEEEFTIEDMIAKEDVVVTISNLGFIKRLPLNGYRRQNRGGKGFKATTTRSEEYVEHLFISTTHNYLLFFTEKGRCYWLKVYQIPEASRLARGRAVVNLIEIEKNDKINTIVPVKNLNDEDYINNHYIIMVTKNGVIKKTKLLHYSHPRKKGIIAINIRDNDELLGAKLTNGNSNIVLANNNGRAIHFREQDVREVGRNSYGVRGMRLSKQEKVVDMVISSTSEHKSLLVISKNGYGKRSSLDDYRIQKRGGKGILTLKTTSKTGQLIALKDVNDLDDLMLITNLGKIIRMSCKGIRVIGRNTQGVRLMRLEKGSSIAAVTRIGQENDTENMDTDAINNDNQTGLFS